MTDFELSYAVMALLYLMECCVTLPEHSVLFTRVFWRWRAHRFPGCAFIGEQRLVLLNPLPWAGEWHVAPSPDATLTDQGVITLNSLHDYPRGLGKAVMLPFADPESKACLRALAAAGWKTKSAAEDSGGTEKEQRLAADRSLAEWTDPAPIRETEHRLRSGLGLVKILGTLQFLWAFAAAPLLLNHFSPERMILPYLFVLFWLSGTVAVSFARIHRRTHGRGWKSFARALWLFAYPLAAMRAAQSLCAGTLPPGHESAVAGAIMLRQNGPSGGTFAPDSARDEAARAYLADITVKLRHRLFCRSLTENASQALARANEALLQAVYANWGMDEIVLPRHSPERNELCFCPVCGIGLAAVLEYCPHCLEVKTVASRHG